MIRVLALEEFAAKRRTAQKETEALLRETVVHSVNLTEDTHGWDELLEKVEQAYEIVYRAETGEDRVPNLHTGWKKELRDTLRKTTSPRDEGTVDRITVWLATWILSQTSIAEVLTDPGGLLLEWVDMDDEAVRPAHRRTSGQQRPPGEPFDVDGVKMPYPGWPGAPVELWINCRCTLRPALAEESEEAIVADGEFRDVSTKERKRLADKGAAMPDGSYPIANCSDLKNAIQAIGRAKDPAKVKAHIRKRKRALGCPDVELPWAMDDEERPDTSGLTCIVALPAEDQPVHGVGDEEKHLTILFLGEFDGDVDALTEGVAEVAQDYQPFTAQVMGAGSLGADDAQVVFVESPAIETLRRELVTVPGAAEAMGASDAHPHFVPHVTLSYSEVDSSSLRGGEITFDRLAVWQGDDHSAVYPLGGEMDNEEPEEGLTADAGALVEVHGVITTEGKKSGDGRGFRYNAMRSRPMPLPLSFQKVSTEGHKNAVVVARIDRQVRVVTEEGKDAAEIRFAGTFRQTPEADEAIGLMADFDGRFGVSVDADESVFELDDDDETVWFSDARSCGACIVPIPAFAEAWAALGPPPEGFMDGEDLEVSGQSVTQAEELVASAHVDIFVDVAPGRTEDGPGWLTHPVDTDRLRDYWVRGPGAAKIGWGAPGDFNRCRVNVAEYVKPQHLNGYCANRHYDALGYWPGQGPHSAGHVEMAEGERAEMVNLVAGGGWCAPSEWLTDPEFTEGDERLVRQKDGSYACPLTITDDGQVFGHLAAWGTCHTGFPNACVTPPRSESNYAYFLLGNVMTDKGPVPCGTLTIGSGHAGTRMSARQAMEHYDNTATSWAYVNVGEDDYGIWVAGAVKPGLPDEMLAAARASKLSGDWRQVGTSLELIAALSVNVPGFPVAQIAAAVEDGAQVSLVASGVVEGGDEPDMTQDDIDRFADAVMARIEAREQRRRTMAEIRARVLGED